MNFDYIGLFIRSYRMANDESLQSLADRSGVSRSMIAQVESGQKSPTIMILAKLANSMNISLEDFVKNPKNLHETQVLISTKENIVSKKESAFICHQLTARSSTSLTDFYQFYFTEHGKTSFSANPISDSLKYLWVEQGELTIYLSSKKIQLKAGQGAKFNASIPHRFVNQHGQLVKGTFLVAYKN
ncbi:helix-turn-helix domain-containing protein [Colwellia psychrerythraea]|uniref:Transcriptional regulator, XRE family with cupin 2 sensor n=1 Tax=Colwellia psychrerythraea TaxID=28229 RepID=A0A099KTB5_COLPS|nr:helix-turn-helix transcriptional regulator [Colwellia psychrerythraea]KGJ94009.1 transcriptional regulator, XRE family with cupin 2 sensor [Colwellia psychrerythraea]